MPSTALPVDQCGRVACIAAVHAAPCFKPWFAKIYSTNKTVVNDRTNQLDASCPLISMVNTTGNRISVNLFAFLNALPGQELSQNLEQMGALQETAIIDLESKMGGKDHLMILKSCTRKEGMLKMQDSFTSTVFEKHLSGRQDICAKFTEAEVNQPPSFVASAVSQSLNIPKSAVKGLYYVQLPRSAAAHSSVC